MIIKEYYEADIETDEKHLYNYFLKETAAGASNTSPHGLLVHPPTAALFFNISTLIHETQEEEKEFFANSSKITGKNDPLARETGVAQEKRVKYVFVDVSIAPESREAALELLRVKRAANKARNPDQKEYFINDDTGAHIYISNSDAKHSMSFRNKAQIQIIAEIDTIIKNAVKLRETPVNENEAKHTESVSIYYCPVNCGVQYSARMVVKEYYKGIFELDEIHLYNWLLKETAVDAPSPSLQMSVDTSGIPAHPPTAALSFKISTLIHETQADDKEFLVNSSKIADKNEPPAGEGGAGNAAAALLGEGVYRTILDFEEFAAFLGKAKAQGFFALDFETDSLDSWHAKPVGISLALRPKEAFYVPLLPHGDTDAEREACPHLDGGKVRAALAPLLADPEMTVAAHNAKYDYEVARGWGLPRWKCRIWDTMIAAWLYDSERTSFSLDSLAAFHFGYTAVKFGDIVPKGKTFDRVPLETACRYSAEDADLCLRMKAHLQPRLQGSTGVSHSFAHAIALFTELEMPLLPILAEMEGVGIKIEKEALFQYGVELSAELDTIVRDTYGIVGHEFNLNSPKQLQEVLFVERKLKPGKKTKTGYSTDVAVLEELARVDRVPRLILRHRTLAKLKSTYVDTLANMADSNGRLHTTFVQSGTATGRLSSREPNLQNIPVRDEEGRRIRRAFVAEEGCLLISADYSQIELVVLAHLSGDKNLIAAFTSGQDVHAQTAALIFGLGVPDVSPEQRRVAKTINFGVMYGMSAFRLSNELGISRSDAAAFIDAYFKTYAGVRAFIDELIRKTEQSGYAETIFGRRRNIAAINSGNKTEKAAAERVAVNTPIQGSAADIVKKAMLSLDAALSLQPELQCKMLLQVHDELILECPAAQAEKSAALVKKIMENAVNLTIPLRVSVETGKRWGDFH
jgi:DNA polymerase I-like protein with 3'-5' exonuclease and polymerase domains